MGFSLVAEGLLKHYLPKAEWAPLITKLGYPVGFLITIVGKQQLFTENTLTPIIPLMHSPSRAIAGKLLKLWASVFLANMAGAHLIAWFLGSTPALQPQFHDALTAVAREAVSVDAWTALLRGIPAGWLIAMIVWLRAASDSSDVAIVVILSYLVSLGGFTHIVAGSVEYAWLVVRGAANWADYAQNYMLPVLAGNILGGISIVAALNHAQVVSDKEQDG